MGITLGNIVTAFAAISLTAFSAQVYAFLRSRPRR